MERAKYHFVIFSRGNNVQDRGIFLTASDGQRMNVDNAISADTVVNWWRRESLARFEF